MNPQKTMTASQPIQAVPPTQAFEAIQLARGTRLAWAPNKVITDDLIKATATLLIEVRPDFPGVVITNLEAPVGRGFITRVPWSGVVAAHG